MTTSIFSLDLEVLKKEIENFKYINNRMPSFLIMSENTKKDLIEKNSEPIIHMNRTEGASTGRRIGNEYIYFGHSLYYYRLLDIPVAICEAIKYGEVEIV